MPSGFGTSSPNRGRRIALRLDESGRATRVSLLKTQRVESLPEES